MHRYLTLLLLVAFGSASVLITNGDFEQDLSVGWSQIVSGSNTSIERSTTFDPDPDYEAYAYKGTGDGYAKLTQMTYIPTTDLQFSASLKLYASSNSTTCWAAGALIIAYLDDTGDLLGETKIYAASYACPWINGPTTSLIQVADSNWHDYSFNINSELSNLPGINPTDIACIEVSLYGFADSG
jgi:hypothetical protein